LITPIEGPCPSCNTMTKWRVLVQELSLRLRGQKEVNQLFKPTRKKKPDEATESDDDLDPSEDEEMSGFLELEEEISREMEGSATTSKDNASPAKKRQKSQKSQKAKNNSIKATQEDNDWTDFEVLD
jgi:hypothetical protein